MRLHFSPYALICLSLYLLIYIFKPGAWRVGGSWRRCGLTSHDSSASLPLTDYLGLFASRGDLHPCHCWELSWRCRHLYLLSQKWLRISDQHCSACYHLRYLGIQSSGLLPPGSCAIPQDRQQLSQEQCSALRNVMATPRVLLTIRCLISNKGLWGRHGAVGVISTGSWGQFLKITQSWTQKQ